MNNQPFASGPVQNRPPPAPNGAEAGAKPGPAASAAALVRSKPQIGLIFRHGFRLLKLYPTFVVAFIALSLAQTCILAGVPQLLNLMITRIQHGGGKGLISLYVLWSVLTLAALAVGPAVRCVQSLLDAKMSNGLRDRLFGIILRQPPGFFHLNEPGSLTLTINQMAVETQVALRQLTLTPILTPFNFAIPAVLIVVNLRQLAQAGEQKDNGWILWGGVGVVLVVALLSPWVASRTGRRLQRESTGLRDQSLALAGLVTGAFTSPEEIQSFRAEDIFSAKHRLSLLDLLKARFRQTVTLETANAASSAPSSLVQVLFAGVAVLLVVVASGQQDNAGALAAIILLVPQLMAPIQAISAFNIQAYNSWPSIEQVLGLLDQEAAMVTPAPSGPGKVHTNGDLGLAARNLTFRYRPDLPPVFDGISFEAPPGKITALVAKMGQGKTTFFRLALRFYDPQAGQILIGGLPTGECSKDAVRKRVAMMSQFPAFFHDTLRENLRMARSDATDGELEMLCRRTGVWPLLEQKLGDEEEQRRFPNPLDRQFAEGKMLSGGQRKLVALTRCLLRSPTHLLLDEPTVGMDRMEEYGLIERLQEACAGRTVLVVNHDPHWLLKFCDHFIVLDEGRIVQQGGRELADVPGLFQDLLRTTSSKSASLEISLQEHQLNSSIQ